MKAFVKSVQFAVVAFLALLAWKLLVAVLMVGVNSSCYITLCN